MIERIIMEYLTGLGYACYMEIPTRMPDEFLVIQKTGSLRADQINQATVAIQSYSTTLVDCVELNESVKEDMLNIITLTSIGSCKLNSDYNYTDSSIKKYRYQAVFDITFY